MAGQAAAHSFLPPEQREQAQAEIAAITRVQGRG